MAKLYFRHGAMGSSKTANALMVAYNYYERGKEALLVKPQIDTRDEGVIRSRMGLEQKCRYVEELVQMSDEEIRKYDCVIVDEAQFCKKSDVEFLEHIVEDLDIPVICYGLRTDFRREVFEGSLWLLAWADVIEELKTVCWCGNGAVCNTRYTEDGQVIREGEQVFVGGNDKYVALCKKHYKEGNLGPKMRTAGKGIDLPEK
ncbi:MAG: thymidine kinase [Muricoprocola sp.]